MTKFSKSALRGLRQRERKEKMAANPRPTVRVTPKEEYRGVLKHPHGGGFPETGAKEWPDDRFTRRRLADGSVTKEEAKQREQPQDDNQRQRDQRSQSKHRVEHHETKREPDSAA